MTETNWDNPEDIKQKAREQKSQREASQAALLDAVAEGEDSIAVENYEWVSVGQVDVKAKAWMPGESLEAIEQAQRLAKRENLSDTMDSIHTVIEGVTAVSERLEHQEEDIAFENKEDIRKFWKGMLNKWGIEGFQKSAQVVLKPATDDMEAKADAADGFRQDTARSKPSDYE